MKPYARSMSQNYYQKNNNKMADPLTKNKETRISFKAGHE